MIITYLKIILGCNNKNNKHKINLHPQKTSILFIINKMDLLQKRIFIECHTEK